MQPGDPGRALRQPPGRQLAARLILDPPIVAILGPVISDEQQCLVLPAVAHMTVRISSLRENGSRPNGSVLTPQRARQPNSGHLSRSLAGGRAHLRTHGVLGGEGVTRPRVP